MNEDEAPILKLIMAKGPLSGQVSEFKSRSRIQIGRVVRGNTIAIKDSGISSKHLTIQFEHGSGRWTVTDLDSSNGSVLSTKSLKPSTPYPLSDGDVIKIGELTDIEVKLEVQVGEKVKEEDGGTKRNTRRRAAAEVVGGGQLGIISENSELGLGFGGEKREENKGKGGARRGRGKPSKNDIEKRGGGGEELENLGGSTVKEENKVVTMRTTRSSKRKDNSGNVEENLNVPLRRTRSSKKAENFKNDQGMENVVVKKVRGKKVENQLKAGEETENVGMEDDEEKGQRTTLTCSIEEENVGEVRNLDVVEGRRRRKGTNEERNLPSEEVVEKGDERNLEADGMEKGNLSIKTSEEVVEKLNLGEEGNLEAAGMETNADMNPGCTSGVKKSDVVLDLEKMTLGEWFDYLEENLPKQIIGQTEEMILEMRRKAERFHEFMLQKKAEEKEVPLN